ncbi:hypothetical protein Tco_1313675 [Tanacetum coccineum]
MRHEVPDLPKAAPASPDYVSGPVEPKQAPLSPDYVSGPEYPEYLAPSNEEVPVEDQPYVVADSPIALSLGYVADSDPEEDSEDGPVDYPADGGDGDDDDKEEEEDGHLTPADSVIAPERLTRCLAAPALPSSPLPIVPHPYGSPNHMRAPLGFRVSIGRLRASSPSTYHLLHPSPPLPPPPSSLHLPPHVPTSLPLPSSPLPSLPASLYEVGESSNATPRPTGGHGIDYGFIGTLDAKTKHQRAEEVDYGIREEQDTQDVYAVIEDTQDRQTQLFQRVDGLVEDRQFHYETARLLDQEALVSREAWAHSVGLSSAVHYELQAYRTHTQMQDFRIASQESLMTTLITHVSSLQGQLSAALGQIQALQARGQTHTDDREGAGSSA